MFTPMDRLIAKIWPIAKVMLGSLIICMVCTEIVVVDLLAVFVAFRRICYFYMIAVYIFENMYEYVSIKSVLYLCSRLSA